MHGWGRVLSSASPFPNFDLWKNELRLPPKVKRKTLIIGPVARRCGTGTAVIIVGLGLHLFNAAEVLISLVFSGILILFLGLALLSGFLVWQGGKRIVAWVASWNSTVAVSRPAVPASLGNNG